MDWVVFDVGNVIVQADHSIGERYLQEQGVHPYMAGRFFDNAEYRMFSRGRITEQHFHEALVGYMQHALTLAQAREAHDRHIYSVDQAVLDIMRKMGQDRLAILTDSNEWQDNRVSQLVDLSQYAELIFQSHKIGMLKIDPLCFPTVADWMGSDPEYLLLVDDSAEKVAAARQAGWNTIRYENHKQLELELMMFDLL